MPDAFYSNTCDGAADACLGVPYFNWGPSYVENVKKAENGTLKQSWQWLSPDFKDINNPDKSPVGFAKAPALLTQDNFSGVCFQIVTSLSRQLLKL